MCEFVFIKASMFVQEHITDSDLTAMVTVLTIDVFAKTTNTAEVDDDHMTETWQMDTARPGSDSLRLMAVCNRGLGLLSAAMLTDWVSAAHHYSYTFLIHHGRLLSFFVCSFDCVGSISQSWVQA